MKTSHLLAVLGLVACSRTPPEPEPAATTSAKTVTTVGTAARREEAAPPSRCITPMSSVAPELPKPASSAECPADPEPPQKLPTAQVQLPEAPGAPKVDVELAMTPHDIEKGLMYRRTMGVDHGMLFKLDERRDHTFWMKNTCIPLDMLFVDDDGTIAGIVEGAAPLTETTRSVGCPTSFVLEMNAGWCRRHGVRPGQRMGLPAAVR